MRLRRTLLPALVLTAVLPLTAGGTATATTSAPPSPPARAVSSFRTRSSPCATTRSPDRKDADYPKLQAAYSIRTLTNLDGSGYLRGDYADVHWGRRPGVRPRPHLPVRPRRRPLRADAGLLRHHRGPDVHPEPGAPNPRADVRRRINDATAISKTSSRGDGVDGARRPRRRVPIPGRSSGGTPRANTILRRATLAASDARGGYDAVVAKWNASDTPNRTFFTQLTSNVDRTPRLLRRHTAAALGPGTLGLRRPVNLTGAAHLRTTTTRARRWTRAAAGSKGTRPGRLDRRDPTCPVDRRPGYASHRYAGARHG